ncbi:MAG TPA: hypothetical protein VK909_04155 [Anaerolineales bacterium]|nr:hypothetical protein [Anaerolineales bacterium]
MNSFFQKVFEIPIVILLAANIIVGLFIFRDYGYSWDEPLFYNYGNALGYAYSPSEWFSGHFDVTNSYGASADDHKTRGPAYLLLSRQPVYLLEGLGLDEASAWHLINFLFFQLGVYFVYRLSRRWVKPTAALATSALFAWQPMLWGHAFINPKDPPFLTFFLASVCLGFEMVDRLSQNGKPNLSTIIIPALILGITTSVRILGPLAGLLVLVYFLFVIYTQGNLHDVKPWSVFFAYGMIAILTMFLTWPYLWENPVARFFDVFRFMSDNPTNLSVLFGGQVYRASDLPRRYLPFMLATTLTEPVWILFLIGVIAGYAQLIKQNASKAGTAFDWKLIDKNMISLTLVLLWFLIPVAYVLLRKPAMYDGIRHFLFILPPIFIFIGFTFASILEYNTRYWLRAAIIFLFLWPGVQQIVRLHPYEYTYYNLFIGGTDNAFRNYETDYWLTCYKDAVRRLNLTYDPARLYVHREAYIAAYYANKNITVKELRGAASEVQRGDYVLVNTRTNEDRRIWKDVLPLIQIQRGKALFCMIKKVP